MLVLAQIQTPRSFFWNHRHSTSLQFGGSQVNIASRQLNSSLHVHIAYQSAIHVCDSAMHPCVLGSECCKSFRRIAFLSPSFPDLGKHQVETGPDPRGMFGLQRTRGACSACSGPGDVAITPWQPQERNTILTSALALKQLPRYIVPPTMADLRRLVITIPSMFKLTGQLCETTVPTRATHPACQRSKTGL
jgi:hypothetical protein